jgi:hypothetical protein
MQKDPSASQTELNLLLPALIALVETIATLTVGRVQGPGFAWDEKAADRAAEESLRSGDRQFNLAVLAGFRDEVLWVVRKAVSDASQGLDDESWLVTAVKIKQKRWRTVSVIGSAIGETILVYVALFAWFASHPWRVMLVAMIVVPLSYMFDPTLDQPARDITIEQHPAATRESGSWPSGNPPRVIGRTQMLDFVSACGLKRMRR